MLNFQRAGQLCVVFGLAAAGLVSVAPAASALTPTDDVTLMMSGGFGYVDVLANDAGTGTEYVDVVAGSDGRVTGTFSAELQVDLTGMESEESEAFSVEYQTFDGISGEPVGGTATLTVHALPETARAESGNAAVTVRWPRLPAAVTGARITYGEDFVLDHDDPGALDTVTVEGGPPWTVPGLQNGVSYGFYVTPRVGTTELAEGSYLDATPRASNAPPVAQDDRVSVVGTDQVYLYPTDNDEDADFDALTISSHSDPAVGTLECESSYCSYDPGPTPTSDSFDYTVSDGHGGTDTATVHLLVRDVTLVDDVFTGLFADEEASVDVRANDSGLLPEDQIFIEFDSPDIYAYEDEDGLTRITAEAAGTYAGTYSAWTSEGQDLGSASIQVTVGPRRSLVAVDDFVTTPMEVPIEVEVARFDRIGDADFPLSTGGTSIVVEPAHGTATLAFEAMQYNDPDGVFDPVTRNLPVITYTPDLRYRGPDRLTYELVDAQGDREQGLVDVTVVAEGAYVHASPVGIDSAHLNIQYDGSPAVDDILVCYTVGADRQDDPATPARPCAHEVPTTGTPADLDLVGLTPDRDHVVSVFTHYDDGTPSGYWSEGQEDFFRPGVDSVRDVWVEAGPSNALLTWVNASSDDFENESTGTTIGWSTTAAPQEPGTGTGWTTVGADVSEVEITGLTAGTEYFYSVFATHADKGSWADPDSGSFTPAAGNIQPVAADDALSVNENTFGHHVDVLANDTDDEELSVRAHTQPENGSADCGDYGCYYSPDSGFSGSDSFTYTVSDGRFGIDSATVSVTVVGVPDPPVAANDHLVLTQGVATPINLAELVHDPDGTTAFTWAIDTPPTGGTLTGCTTGTCTYTGTTPGEDSFVYRATDPTGLSDTATVSITVVANQLPVTEQGHAQVDAGASVALDLNEFASDPDGDTLTYSGFTAAAKGTIACNASGACTYAAGAGTEGTDSFNYTVTDDKGGAVVGSVVITIIKVNHAPVATNASRSTENGVPLGVNLADLTTDADDDALTYTKVAGPTPAAAGTVTCAADGNCTYTPSPTFTGQLTFTYRANDGEADSNVATVTVTVTQSNRAPVADDESVTAVTGEPTVVDVANGDTDADGDDLTFAKASDPAHGTTTCTPAGACTYTSDVGYSGADSFTYTVSDGRGGTDTGTVSVTVGANQPPVADDETVSTRTNHAVTVDVAQGDTDPNGHPLTFEKASDPAHGTATCTPTGRCTYTPSAGYGGPDSFTYTVSDGHGGSDSGTVGITVLANRAPVADDEAVTVLAGTPIAVDVANGDTDADGDPLSYAEATGPGHGSVTCTTAGVCTYTSAAAYNGPDSFTYTVSDGEGGQDSATVTVTVTYIAPPPPPVPGPAPPPPPPVLTPTPVPAPTISVSTAPKVTGKLKVGKVLKAKGGAYAPTATTVSYRWLRNGKAIKKATKASYKLVGKDRGKRISLQVVYTLPGATTVTKVVKVKGKVKP